ncbi:MAG TPA: MATE family efflux transporter [Bacteroidetes bacterium]|nr:MATE family efflux transporter [Bacteroidota bacterium]
MSISTSYKNIFAVAFPIMLGSAAQNVIGLSDSIFLFHYSELDFAAIALVSVFYLIIASIGYGFSKGGQIIIARRLGEWDIKGISRSFYTLLIFEIVLAIIMFVFMRYGSSWFLKFFIKSPDIYEHSLMYIKVRAFGVFFSYAGISIIALYTGIARTKFIIVDSLILVVSNVILNYLLIFGEFGFPEMGIRGAALASVSAEVIGISIFVIYMILGGSAKQWGLNLIPKFEFGTFKNILKLSSPIVAQSVISLGSWFIFFSLIEVFLGQKALAISNLIRNVSLILTIPSWGFSSAINTFVGQMIGSRKRMGVMPIIRKTANMNLIITLILALPVVLFPSFTLYPLFGGENVNLIYEGRNVFYVLFVILILASVGMVYFNGLSGTGASMHGMKIQAGISVVYLLYIYLILKYANPSLELAWTAEILYWILVIFFSLKYMFSKRWYGKKF